MLRLSIFFVVCTSFTTPFLKAQEIDPPNTQEETIPLLSPEEALAKMKLPDGFKAQLESYFFHYFSELSIDVRVRRIFMQQFPR